jgi:hypothetical protein
MRISLGTFLIASVVALAAPAAAAAGWEQPWVGVSSVYGGINQAAEPASNPSLIEVKGVAYVAWLQSWWNAGGQVRVARLEDGRWVQPWPGVSDTSGGINQDATQPARSPRLAAVKGMPYLAWSEFSWTTGWQIRVARLEDERWVQPWDGVSDQWGGINQSGNRPAESPSIADGHGVPWVAWSEYSDTGDRQIRVATLDDNRWVQPWAGVSSNYGGVNQAVQPARDPVLAFAKGTPYVAWSEFDRHDANWELRVARLDDTRWSQRWPGVSATSGGLMSDTTVDATSISIAVLRNVPHVAWSEGYVGRVMVARLEHGRWIALPRVTDPNAMNPVLAVIGHRLHLAWIDSNLGLRVSVLADVGWTDAFGPGPNSGPLWYGVHLALAGLGRIPHVAWSEGDQLRIARPVDVAHGGGRPATTAPPAPATAPVAGGPDSGAASGDPGASSPASLKEDGSAGEGHGGGPRKQHPGSGRAR